MVEVFARPPNFDEIDDVFKVAGLPVIFAYGGTIYNPERTELTESLRAHEEVHGIRQGSDIEGWWKRYISDTKFRLNEEIPAHIAEYKKVCEISPTRNQRRVALHHIAARLASGLYGGLIRYEDARRLIKAAA